MENDLKDFSTDVLNKNFNKKVLNFTDSWSDNRKQLQKKIKFTNKKLFNISRTNMVKINIILNT
jgi:hypothetical protein